MSADAMSGPAPVPGPECPPDAAAGGDPSVALVASYRRAALRMTGLAFVNPALEVEAVGFALWNGHWLGVLVTPWFMNLVLAPGDRAQWPAVAAGAKRMFTFPAGQYEFIGARDDDVGDFLACSLFSPVLEFEDHATARLVAELAREALFDGDNAEAPEAPADRCRPNARDRDRVDACTAAGRRRGGARRPLVQAQLPARTFPGRRS